LRLIRLDFALTLGLVVGIAAYLGGFVHGAEMMRERCLDAVLAGSK
jgi:hypothetical protein